MVEYAEGMDGGCRWGGLSGGVSNVPDRRGQALILPL